ncbi:DUF3564 family protein [Paraburkholderia guartelaensis]|uniref:DUF3564 family protein n=2 Tax=Paraburkholderia guartelaensis TaxID=2546446 RepID=A0A4R5L657_9BURK|nr:DUF3564 family protein [Paraburkholderia guartelaensis]
MRLTILINGPDPTVNHDYAVLWLDLDEQRWSREAHSGLALPEWGELRQTDASTLLCSSSPEEPVCALLGLVPDRHNEVESADGVASFPAEAVPGRRTDWHWRLQAVDRSRIRAASAFFASEEMPPLPRSAGGREPGRVHR